MVAAPIPAVEIGILAVLQDVLLPSEVGVVEAHPSSTLDADGVDPVEETLVLEAVAAATDVQLPACEAFAFVESDLGGREENGPAVRSRDTAGLPVHADGNLLQMHHFRAVWVILAAFQQKEHGITGIFFFFLRSVFVFLGTEHPAFLTLLAASCSLTHTSSRNV